MKTATLYRRTLRFHWRTNLATTLCVATAAAVLTGAMLVGDSMRGSLREMALRRLGPVDHALVAARFFPADLAARLAGDDQFKASAARACPLILVQGTVEHAGNGTRVSEASVLGIDESFLQLGQDHELPGLSASGTSVILNEPLARRLGARTGEDILIRLGARTNVSAETLFGQRDVQTVSLRLTVTRIVPAHGWGCFSLNPAQQDPCNAYIPLSTLQRALKQRGRINAILVAGGQSTSDTAWLQQILSRHVQLSDLGLKLRRDDQRAYAALESENLMLPPAVETAAKASAKALDLPTTSLLTYLANTISVESPGRGSAQPVQASTTAPTVDRSIPYSTVTAIEQSDKESLSSMTLVEGGAAPAPKGNEILLNDWAAADLQARNGDRIRLTYYVIGPFGQLNTEEAIFVLHGVVRMQGLADDPGLTPEYKGVTDARRVTDWDPPFPIDLDRIRPKDETYWDNHRATPKAFISLHKGQTLWAGTADRLGRLSQIRFGPVAGKRLAATTAAFERELLHRLTPRSAGLAFEPVRAQAIAASQGSTDFAMLFMSFSMFLILAAAMLVALVFRLGVERRSSEMGLLLAVGFPPRSVTFALLIEGAILAALGSAVGLAGAIGYARLLLTGLSSWWADAASVPSLRLYVQGTSLLAGWAASVLVSLVSIAWAVRGMSRMSARSLLSGCADSPAAGPADRRSRRSLLIALSASVVAVLLIILSALIHAIPQAPAFFGSGAALLVAGLAALSAWTRQEHRLAIAGTGLASIARVGIRNAARNSPRSLLTAGLIASATFIIIAVGANRQHVSEQTPGRQSGTGGFSLVAESTSPILQDLTTAQGREALGLQASTRNALAQATVMPLRLRSGDEASCLNLYQPRQPRILGATAAMIDRGGFRFKATLAQDDATKQNPWTLLMQPLPDGATPAIADDNTVTWLLHLGLGKDLTITDEQGREVPLRFVGLLSGSILQGEVVIAESQFTRLFPSISGYRFFLIESPAAEQLRKELEQDLANYGLEITPATERLARYLAVENAYLSAFQTLGGLGLILGTLGLAAVLLRGVFERRGELALLQALGWRPFDLKLMVLAENSVLLLSGLAAGALSAMLAVAPHALSSVQPLPWVSLGLTLAVVFLVGTIAAWLAIIAVIRAPLLPALRTE